MALALGLGVGLTVVGSIGLFFGRLIKASVSRQRETLADASAVQFTRDPSGLAGALRKIGGYTGQLSSRNSEEIAHMLFSRGSAAFRGWFSTHPPLDERIRALDPAFTPGDYPTAAVPVSIVEDADTEMLVRPLAEGDGGVTEASILERAGQVAPHTLATALRVAIPQELYHAAHSPETSLLLVIALALGVDSRVRQRQIDFLEKQLGASRANRCAQLAKNLLNMDQRLKLPLLELSVPALKQRPAEQLDFLSDTLSKLAEMNPNARLFDYVLLRVLESFLDELPNSTLKRAKREKRLTTSEALAALLRCVASYGNEEPTAARDAFSAGLAAVSSKGGRISEPSFESSNEARDLNALNDALVCLARIRPREKQTVLTAVLACIRHDHRINIPELELFRAIAATLGCPLPPAAAINADP